MLPQTHKSHRRKSDDCIIVAAARNGRRSFIISASARTQKINKRIEQMVQLNQENAS